MSKGRKEETKRKKEKTRGGGKRKVFMCGRKRERETRLYFMSDMDAVTKTHEQQD